MFFLLKCIVYYVYIHRLCTNKYRNYMKCLKVSPHTLGYGEVCVDREYVNEKPQTVLKSHLVMHATL